MFYDIAAAKEVLTDKGVVVYTACCQHIVGMLFIQCHVFMCARVFVGLVAVI